MSTALIKSITSNRTHQKGYKGPKPILKQIDALARILSLSSNHALEYAEKVLPTRTFPDGCEGPFAIANHNALVKRFFPEVEDDKERLSRAASLIVTKIGESRELYNYREGELTPDRFRLNGLTAHALERLAEEQQGDIWIVGAQFGKRHAGKTVCKAREDMIHPEFGAHTVAVGSMLLTHPERFVSNGDLWLDIPGDDFDPVSDGSFGVAPLFEFLGGAAGFGTRGVNCTDEHYGSVSLFLPQ